MGEFTKQIIIAIVAAVLSTIVAFILKKGT
jgi:hypothetical protein